jgi:hypothetical protein
LQVEPGKKYGVSIGGINNFDYLDYLKNAFMEYNDMYGAL